MAHPLLLSLTNIDSNIRSKGSLHGFVLLTLLPVASFIHKKSCICTLLSDRLVHESLDFMLHPLKIAAAVGVMMSDPVGNLRYCFTPLVAYISDTPEQSLLAGTGPKASPVSTALIRNSAIPFHIRLTQLPGLLMTFSRPARLLIPMTSKSSSRLSNATSSTTCTSPFTETGYLVTF